MTSELIQAIEAERHRQNVLHPVAFASLLPEESALDEDVGNIQSMARILKAENDREEKAGTHNAFHVAAEEMYEFFATETKEEQLIEAIQNIAFWVRIYEELA